MNNKKFIRVIKEEEYNKIKKEIEENVFDDDLLFFSEKNYIEVPDIDRMWNYKVISILDDLNNCVGFIQIDFPRMRKDINLAFYITKDERRQGYFQRAFKEFLDFCKEFNYLNICITTTNEQLLDLYKKIGFDIVGCQKKVCLNMKNEICDKYYLQLLIKK